MDDFKESFLELDHENMTVDKLWLTFKNELKMATMKFVPHKVHGVKKLPWITRYITLLIRKRHKMHIKVKEGKNDLTNSTKSTITRKRKSSSHSRKSSKLMFCLINFLNVFPRLNI